MKVCCIIGCSGPDEKDAVFFDFPTSRLLRKRWTNAISASSLPQDAVICIRHFSTEDYELIRGKTRLKSKVVPSLGVGDKPNSTEDTENSKESQNTTDAVTSGRSSRNKQHNHTNKVNNHNGDNHNGNNDNQSGNNENKHTGKIADNETIVNVTENHGSNENNTAKEDLSENKDINSVNNKSEIDNGKDTNHNLHNDIGIDYRPYWVYDNKDNEGTEKNNHDNVKVIEDDKKSHNESDNVNNDSSKNVTDTENVNSESAKVKSDNEIVSNNSEIIHKNSENVKNNNNKDSNKGEKVKDDSEKAKNDNDKAKDDSEKAKDDSEKSKDDSEKAKDDSEKAKDDSEKSKDDSEKAKDDSEKAKNDNDKAKDDSEKAKDDSEKSKVNSEKAKDFSENVDNNTRKDTSNVVNYEKVPHRKSRCKITPKRAKSSRNSSKEDSDSSSLDSVSSSPPPPPPPALEIEGSKDDIEGLLTNYIIENKKTERQVAAMTDVLEEERRGHKRGRKHVEEEFRGFERSEPVFIELSVGQGYPKYPGCSIQTSQDPAANDCLMVLESVQCDVDPALLLAAREGEGEEVEEVDLAGDDDDDDEPVVVPMVKKKEDPISLLTSSDEDDVIIQEPKIDTVEVSSADTSEDDMPLVKLLKKDKKKSHKSKTADFIKKLLWGGSDFYCVHCGFNTTIASDYTKHMENHTSKVLEVCQDCDYATSSKSQLRRHRSTHRADRRFQCQSCSYSAKHKMSLVYHMKTHKNRQDVEIAICGTFEPSPVSNKKRKVKDSDKKQRCTKCIYKTNRLSDLRRHMNSVHKLQKCDSDDDDDYRP